MIQIDPAHRYEDLGTALRAIGALSIEAEMARDSYRRLLAQPATKVRAFFGAFYQELLTSSPEAKRKFGRRGFPPLEGERPRAAGKKRAAGKARPRKHWRDQYALLREAILLLLAFEILGEDDGPGDTILTGIVRTHGFGSRGLRVSRDAYQAFADALVEIAPRHDPVWEEADEETRQVLRNAWRTTIASGIGYLEEHAPKA
jgi:hypothetical protein